MSNSNSTEQDPTVELVYRAATPQDKQNIIDIGDVYHGYDYLPDYIDHFFDESSGHLNYVATANGNIIAYTAASLVNDGKDFLTRATRVSHDFRSRGVAKRLKETALKLTRTEETQFEVISVNSHNIEAFTKPGKERYVKIMEMDVNVMNVTAAEVTEPCPENVKQLDEDILLRILNGEAEKSELFPRDLIVIDWVPLKPILANAKIILCDMVEGFYSEGSPSPVVTFTSRRFSKEGSLFQVDVYGSNQDAIENHLRFHVKRAKAEVSRKFGPEQSKKIIVTVQADVDHNKAAVSKAITNLGCESERGMWESLTVFRCDIL